MKFPFYEQLDAMECGPACLSMIAKQNGKEDSLDTLHKSCFISKEGVSLLGIGETAESIGFKTLGGRFTFENLASDSSF